MTTDEIKPYFDNLLRINLIKDSPSFMERYKVNLTDIVYLYFFTYSEHGFDNYISNKCSAISFIVKNKSDYDYILPLLSKSDKLIVINNYFDDDNDKYIIYLFDIYYLKNLVIL